MAKRSRTLRRHARAMRRQPTRAEGRLWFWLRDRRCAGFKFRRQVPIGRYIVDFYCVELKLGIELDGSHHQSAWMADYESQRIGALRERGIRLLRIPNELLARNSILVGEQISAVIAEITTSAGRNRATPHPPSAPSPLCGGEKGLDGEVFGD